MTPRPLRRSAATLTAVVLTTLLAACSGGSSGPATSTLPAYTPEASGAATASASASSSASATLAFEPADPKGIGLVNTYTGATPETARQKKIFTVWLKYGDVLSQALNGAPNWSEIFAVTAGKTRQEVGVLVTERIKGKIGNHKGNGKLYTVGTIKIKVISIDDAKSAATITYCVDDQSYEIDKSGKTIVSPPGISKASETLTLDQGSWKVTTARSLGGNCSM